MLMQEAIVYVFVVIYDDFNEIIKIQDEPLTLIPLSITQQNSK